MMSEEFAALFAYACVLLFLVVTWCRLNKACERIAEMHEIIKRHDGEKP